MNDDADIVDDVDANNCIEGLLEEDDDVIDIKFTGIIGVPLLILLLVRVVLIGSTGTSCIGTGTGTDTDTGTCIQDIATSKVLHSNKRGIQQKMETLLILTIIALVVCFIILCVRVRVRVVPTLTSEWIFRRILLQSMMISATCSS